METLTKESLDVDEKVILSRRAYDKLLSLASMDRQCHASMPIHDDSPNNGGPVARLVSNNRDRWAVYQNARRLNPQIDAEHKLRQRWRLQRNHYLRQLAKRERARNAHGYLATLYDPHRNTSKLVKLGAIHTYNTGVMVYAHEYLVEPDGLVRVKDGFSIVWAKHLLNPKRSESWTVGNGLTLKQARQVINGPLYYQGIPKEG